MNKSKRVPENKRWETLALAAAQVTTRAAIEAMRHHGRGDKIGADQSAVNALRQGLNNLNIDGVIVIGEGEKDKAPMLHNGERVGRPRQGALKTDIAVDPIDGTRLLAHGQPGALSVLACVEQGTLWQPGSSFYAEKIAFPRAGSQAVRLQDAPTKNLRRIAKALGKDLKALRVFVLERPRHHELAREIMATGAQVVFHTDGDVAGTIRAAMPNSDIDVMMGIGGTPEAVISAVAVKALGGELQIRPAANDATPQKDNPILNANELVRAKRGFVVLTGITSGHLVKGVEFSSGRAAAESMIIMLGSSQIKTIRITS